MIVSVPFSCYELLVVCASGFSLVATGRGFVRVQRAISMKTSVST